MAEEAYVTYQIEGSFELEPANYLSTLPASQYVLGSWSSTEIGGPAAYSTAPMTYNGTSFVADGFSPATLFPSEAIEDFGEAYANGADTGEHLFAVFQYTATSMQVGVIADPTSTSPIPSF
jgi:hypothetical protein